MATKKKITEPAVDTLKDELDTLKDKLDTVEDTAEVVAETVAKKAETKPEKAEKAAPKTSTAEEIANQVMINVTFNSDQFAKDLKTEITKRLRTGSEYEVRSRLERNGAQAFLNINDYLTIS